MSKVIVSIPFLLSVNKYFQKNMIVAIQGNEPFDALLEYFLWGFVVFFFVCLKLYTVRNIPMLDKTYLLVVAVVVLFNLQYRKINAFWSDKPNGLLEFSYNYFYVFNTVEHFRLNI